MMQIVIKTGGVLAIAGALAIIGVLAAKRGARPTLASAQSIMIPNVTNVARSAKVTVSSTESGYTQAGLNDGLIAGYPENKSAEWSSDQLTKASCTLSWNTPQTVDRIRLYDRPNPNDQVTSGVLTFSDGTTLAVGTLANTDRTPLDIKFPPKTITSVTFRITAMAPKSEHAGLAELEVFKATAQNK